MRTLLMRSPATQIAVFSRPDDRGGMHYYFTPDAKLVARGMRAEPCDLPSSDEAGGLLIGHTAARDLL